MARSDAEFGDLADAKTGKEIRPATREELETSRAMESRWNPAGVFWSEAEGKLVFVYEPGS